MNVRRKRELTPIQVCAKIAQSTLFNSTRIRLTAACCLSTVICALLCPLATADWPMYRHNAGRTGYTAAALPNQLALRWSVKTEHRPQPAWPRSDRMLFDRAFQPVVADGRLFYGDSVDGSVTARDLTSGKLLWKFHTEGPIRFAPAVWQDRLFVASDDGRLYALATATGQLLWERRGGPDQRSILGNERLISKWPARGGPVVVEDTVLFAAGIWPTDGIYLYALDARNGDILWKNDQSGSIYMPQPHGGASAESGIAAQGYLAATTERVFVPTGRAVPATFDRHNGKLAFFHLQKYGHNGGSAIMAAGDQFYNGGLSFNASSGLSVSKLGGGQSAIVPGGLVRNVGAAVTGYKWVVAEKKDRKGQIVKTKALKSEWSVKGKANATALVVAGNQVVTGGAGYLQVVDTKQQRIAWTTEVDGTAYGLAISDGRLLVSTDLGAIHCFDASGEPFADIHDDRAKPAPVDSDYQQLALEIIRRTGMTRGFCLDLGCGDGRLALALAQQTELQIIAVDDDIASVAKARSRLAAAGLLGTRVTVHHRDLAATGYPKYFANLIVSGRSATESDTVLSEEAAGRLLQPYGGISCVGPRDTMQVVTRGDLAGAGSWTHQYANPANTLNSEDKLVQSGLTMLWFRDVDFEIPQRHGRAPAPLAHRGRLFHEGLDGLVAVDAYNGREMWRYDVPNVLRAYNGDELMGVAGTGSNFCVDDEGVYVRHEQRCLRLSAAEGTLQREFPTPLRKNGDPGTWGYIAVEAGTLFGSVAQPEHVVTYRYRNSGGDMSKLLTESESFFALDTETGDLLWRYDAQHSIRHNSIAIGNGHVYLIDRPVALHDRQKKPKSKEHPVGRLVCLEASTGKVKWRNDDDIFGTVLAFSNKHDALLMSYQPTRFRLDSEIGGRIRVYRASTGKPMWDAKEDYASRPMINNRTIYAQGGAWDLLTGKRQPFKFSRSYGCGILAGSQNLLLFRSATLGYFDLKSNDKIANFGGMRPGCWVNALPAGGIVLVPDASAGCRCSYLNKAWVALESQP
jgi:outer membrane protein assembly factor BamB